MQTTDAGEQPNRIQVVVRVRPVLPQELSDDVAVTCSPDARKLQVLLPDRLSGGANLLPGATRTGARSYEFDACISGSTTQEELFDTCGLSELVEAALDGYCVTVFAFGQTGSGKTHTIIGPRLSRGAGGNVPSTTARLDSINSASATSNAAAATSTDDLVVVQPPGSGCSTRSTRSNTASAGAPPSTAAGGGSGASGGILVDPEDGILTRCIATAYRSMEARSGAAEFSVSASVVELYNESVTDLLALDKSKPLQVRKDNRDGFAVTGLTQVACPTDVAAMRYMMRALQYRHTRGHKLNEYSSRSHCLMTFVFSSREAGPDGQMGAKGGIRRYGKLALVDLAGSERLKDTGNTERGAVRETGAINKSLFTLGQVLAGLSARSCGSTTAFVPFRDSKLTQLLWDGLRGSGRCLMLACLGPMRGAAEESLNTLHFATMATRIKAEPVVLLDPQDQLVLDLRKTITQLREENRQLAGALQQLSSGTDPSAVLSNLPDGLRSQAGAADGSPPRSAASNAEDSSGGGSSTSQRPQHHLQPLASEPAGRSARQLFDTNGDAAGPSPERLGTGGGTSSSAAAAAMQTSISVPAVLQRLPSTGLRASYGSSVGGQGAGGGSGSASFQRASASSAMDAPSPSPSQIAAGGSRSRTKPQLGGGAGRTPSPLQSVYGARTSPSTRVGAGRGGRKASSPTRGAGSSPREGSTGSGAGQSRSVGRGPAGRPAYLTEDPGALLFGLSSAVQLQPGSSNSSGTSLPALAPPLGRAAAGGPGIPPPPLPAMSEFPELAALEAEFQNLMANGGVGMGRAGPGAVRGSAGGLGMGAGAGSAFAVGGAAAAAAASGPEDEDGGAPVPDVRALKWAERNSWFGTDYDMTAFAYQVHDRLVDVERMDPNTDIYYMEIERRVAERFPERWMQLMRDPLPGGSGAAAAAGIRRAAVSPARLRASETRSTPLPPSQLQQQLQQQLPYGAALRVSVKDPLVRRSSGGSAAAGSSNNSNSSIAASLAAQAAAVRARQQAQLAGYDSGYEYGEGVQGSGPNTPPINGAVNPFNIGALHSMAPPRAPRGSGPGGAQGMVLIPGGSEPQGRGSGFDAMADHNASERIQREYARQRALVVEELRKAKEDAEAERQRILARIQRAAGGHKWRT